MPVAGAVIGGVASLGGAAMASHGASKAAKAQERATQADIASREKIFERQVALQEPFRQGSMAAQNRLMTLLGLALPDMGGSQPTGGNVMLGGQTINGPFGQVTIPGTSQPSGGTVNATGLRVNPNDPDFGKYARDFGMQDFDADPGYQFRMDEGMKALERSAAARGGLLSGSMLKGIQRYGQDLGSQEYQNAFNRYQINRSNQLNPLQSMMGAGQSAANTLTSAAGQMGEGISAAINNGGAARASGYIGQANALSGALNGIGNMAMQYPQMQAQNNFYNAMTNNMGSYSGGLSQSINPVYGMDSLVSSNLGG